MSIAMDIAEAVAAQINAGASGITDATATRRAVYELEDLKGTLTVAVVPDDVTWGSHDRARPYRDFRIVIGFAEKLDGTDAENAARAEVIEGYVEAVGVELYRERLTDYANARWVAAEQPALFDTEAWDESRQYRTVLIVTYRVGG